MKSTVKLIIVLFCTFAAGVSVSAAGINDKFYAQEQAASAQQKGIAEDGEGTIAVENQESVGEKDLAKYMRDSLEVVAARCAESKKAAYMAGKLLGVNEKVPGWEGYPVELWEYYTGVDIKEGVKKRGLVYMLNPDAVKMAKWIINAVYDVRGEVRYEDIEKVRKFITWQSGTQFPVSGVVYEDMYVAGDYYPYLFKDGVTVYVSDEAKWKSETAHPTDEQLEFYLRMQNSDLKDYTGRYARICSTNREMYYKAGGKDEVGFSDDGKRSVAWLDTVKRLYKEAWNSERNFLIYAWALSNLE